MSDLVRASALDELQNGLREGGSSAEIAQTLRALQRMRATRDDIQVHIERVRAVNDATSRDPRVEERCLEALDAAEGRGALALLWDAPTMAPIHLSSLYPNGVPPDAVEHALLPNDLLPPRPYELLPPEVTNLLAAFTADAFAQPDRRILEADLYRVPKGRFTTRPAAHLHFPDLVALEALADAVCSPLDRHLPASVEWPRGRDRGREVGREFIGTPTRWASSYVVKADVANFYSSISHSVLALISSTHLKLPRLFGLALEGVLTASMGIDVGLPQGPPGSDVLASCFLLPVDVWLDGNGIEFVRYADDYLLRADTFSEAQALLQSLEVALGQIGLSLSSEKTAIIRGLKYAFDLADRGSDLENLKRQLREPTILPGVSAPSWTASQLVSPEESTADLWDALYGVDDTRDGVELLASQITPAVGGVYRNLLWELANRLRHEADNPSASEFLARECLLYLTAAKTVAPSDATQPLLDWFPRLAPAVARYLATVAGVDPAYTAEELLTHLERDRGGDWARGWICSVVAEQPHLATGQLRERLVEIMEEPAEGQLARVGAARALLAAGLLDGSEWSALSQNLSQAMGAEMRMEQWLRSHTSEALAEPPDGKES